MKQGPGGLNSTDSDMNHATSTTTSSSPSYRNKCQSGYANTNRIHKQTTTKIESVGPSKARALASSRILIQMCLKHGCITQQNSENALYKDLPSIPVHAVSSLTGCASISQLLSKPEGAHSCTPEATVSS